MQISGSQARKMVAVAIGLYVGLDLFPDAWAAVDLLPASRAEAVGGVIMALLAILGATAVFGNPRIAALLLGVGAVMGIYLGNTSVLTNLDMWGSLLLIPAGLAGLAAWEESQDLDSPPSDADGQRSETLMAMDYPVPVLPRPSLLRDGLVLALILAVGLLDQSTKFLVQRFMELGESIPAEGFVRLTYVVNPGAAFGLFQGQSMFLTVGSFLGIGVLVLFYYRAPFPGGLLRLSLGLQLGGAVGNLLDRLRLGEVVDFVDVGPWPIFNVADSAIVVGIGLLMALVLFTDLWGVRRVPISPLVPCPADGVPPRVGC